jgi:hypothetical protein
MLAACRRGDAGRRNDVRAVIRACLTGVLPCPRRQGRRGPHSRGASARPRAPLHIPSLLHSTLVPLSFMFLKDDRDAARAYLVEAVALRQSFGRADPAGHDPSLMALGAVLDEPEAVLWAGAQILYETPAEPWVLGGILESLAAVVVAHWPERAATLQGASDAFALEGEHGLLAATRRSHSSVDRRCPRRRHRNPRPRVRCTHVRGPSDRVHAHRHRRSTTPMIPTTEPRR